MKRGGPIKRSKPMPKVNRKRKAKRAAEDAVYGSFFRWVKGHPCAVQGDVEPCLGEVTGHHLKTVGSGGQDAGNVVPLCARHHTEIHTIGPSAFDAKYFNDLTLYAAHLWETYQGAFDPEGA